MLSLFKKYVRDSFKYCRKNSYIIDKITELILKKEVGYKKKSTVKDYNQHICIL